MPNKGHSSDDKTPLSGNGWIAGIIGGQLIAFAVAILLKSSIPVMLVLVLIGSLAGGIIGARQQPKKAAPLRDKRIRDHVFEALTVTSKKLNEVIIEEQFNGVSGTETDRRSMKTNAPKLNVPMPPPPKMGGIM